MPTFIAIDFETSHYQRDSACCLAVVRVEGERVVGQAQRLICPPRRPWMLRSIHGISRADVEGQGSFAEVWEGLQGLVRGADYVVAHNAPFDKGVLGACCRTAGLVVPSLPFVCTVRQARRVWGLYPTTLPHVCAHLGIALKHHDALSDAAAAAEIHLRALRAEAR